VDANLPQCDPLWSNRRVKYDIRHFMANFFLMCVTKDSALFKYFCVAVSDAIFKIIPSSRRAVVEHLRFLGLDDGEIKRVRRKYWRLKGQYFVPEPDVLVRDLTEVYDFFRDLIDPSSGRLFFNSDHAKRFRNEMIYVRKGLLSEIPGMKMYIKTGEYKSGLARCICIRSSSMLEGYHTYLNRVSSYTSGRCTP
ncbi:unnamed protein product, partial [Laminaria digitata]